MEDYTISIHTLSSVAKNRIDHERKKIDMSAVTREHIAEAFDRMDLRQISGFVLYGTEDIELYGEPYHVRLNNGSKAIFRQLKEICTDKDKMDLAYNDLTHALATYQDVYTEIGIKIGARLLHQLLLSDEGSGKK